MSFMAFPALYLFLAAIVFDIPAKHCVSLLLSPSYYLLCFWAVLTGYSLWEMKRWSWYVFLLTNVLIGYSNAILVNQYGETHHKLLAFIFSILLLLLLLFRVGREVRVPYFLPRIRWWESNPRYRLIVPVSLGRDTSIVDGEILDLSLSGCFVKLRNELKKDESLTMKFVVFGLFLECSGTVVWRTQSTVTHPQGVGIKFSPLLKPQRKKLKSISHHLKKISSLYTSSRYLMSQDEFFKRMDELQTTDLSHVKRG